MTDKFSSSKIENFLMRRSITEMIIPVSARNFQTHYSLCKVTGYIVKPASDTWKICNLWSHFPIMLRLISFASAVSPCRNKFE
jgi:hypothetical protein